MGDGGRVLDNPKGSAAFTSAESQEFGGHFRQNRLDSNSLA